MNLSGLQKKKKKLDIQLCKNHVDAQNDGVWIEQVVSFIQSSASIIAPVSPKLQPTLNTLKEVW